MSLMLCEDELALPFQSSPGVSWRTTQRHGKLSESCDTFELLLHLFSWMLYGPFPDAENLMKVRAGAEVYRSLSSRKFWIRFSVAPSSSPLVLR
jgi:hypothetical protein